MAASPSPLVPQVTTAASDLLAALNDEQRTAAVFDFGDVAARRDWHYVPRIHPGLALARIDADQHKAVHRLLAATLSPPVYAQAATILALEDVLDEREGGRRDRRPTDAAVSIFGEPGSAPWSWRLEGHHIAVNATVIESTLTATPLFLGANPARVQHAGVDVVRPLAPEEDIARALLHALDPAQRAAAMVAPEAPRDILTTNAIEVASSDVPWGVAAADLNDDKAAALLVRLLSVYAGRVATADPSLRDPTGVHFAWAGSAWPGQPHYYRLQGPHVFVEYDNTENDANHVHSVWRRPDDDFGRGLLARHRATERAAVP